MHNVYKHSVLKFFSVHVVQAEITDGVTDMLENETLPSIFTCQATGEPVPNITWYFNDIMINVSDTKYNISASINGTVVTIIFTITSSQSSDVGRYTCFAENLIGNDKSSGVLTINGMYISSVSHQLTG